MTVTDGATTKRATVENPFAGVTPDPVDSAPRAPRRRRRGSGRAQQPGNDDARKADSPARANQGDGQAAARKRRRRGSGRTKQRTTTQDANAPTATPQADGQARALAQSLQEAVLRHSTGAVLNRGRGYVKRKRVSELRVTAGTVRARVLGSADRRYHVELSVRDRPAPPIVRKVRWTCDCPYAAEHRRGTCKHVVAVAIVAAQKLSSNESMRRRWFGRPAGNAVEADAAEIDALAARLTAAFTAEPARVGDVLDRALSIAPPPFEVSART